MEDQPNSAASTAAAAPSQLSPSPSGRLPRPQPSVRYLSPTGTRAYFNNIDRLRKLDELIIVQRNPGGFHAEPLAVLMPMKMYEKLLKLVEKIEASEGKEDQR
jgi:hypothetical protein